MREPPNTKVCPTFTTVTSLLIVRLQRENYYEPCTYAVSDVSRECVSQVAVVTRLGEGVRGYRLDSNTKRARQW